MNRDFFIGTTSVQGSVYHAGILFLNGAGFWGRVSDVRGRGLAIGVELIVPDGSRMSDRLLAKKVVYQAWKEGLILYYVGGNVLEITPPLIIDTATIDIALEKLAQAIRRAPQVTDEELRPFAGW